MALAAPRTPSHIYPNLLNHTSSSMASAPVEYSSLASRTWGNSLSNMRTAPSESLSRKAKANPSAGIPSSMSLAISLSRNTPLSSSSNRTSTRLLLSPSASSSSSIIKAGSTSSTRSALAAADSRRGAPSMSVNDAVRQLTSAGEISWQEAVEAFQSLMVHPRCSQGNILYNVMLKILGEARQWGKCEELFQEMERLPEESGGRPDNYTFSTLISCSVKANELELAFKWVEEMASRPECVPDQITYSVIIHALSQSGQPAEALRIFQRMCDSGWEIDSATYGTVMSLYTNARQYRLAHSFYSKLKESGKKLEESIYNCILTTYRNQGYDRNALEVIGDMQASGVTPSAVTHTLVLQTLAKAGETKSMYEYFRRAKQSLGEPPSSFMYNVLIGSCRQSGHLDSARAHFHEMLSEGVAPDESTYRLMLSVFSELGDQSAAIQAQQGLESLGIPMDIKSYSNLIQGYARSRRMEALRSVAQEMKMRGIEADSQLTCILLTLLTQALVHHRETQEDPSATAALRSQATAGGDDGASATMRPGGDGGMEEGGSGESLSGSLSGSLSVSLSCGAEFQNVVECLEVLNSEKCWEIVSTVQAAVAAGEAESDIAELAGEFLEGMDGRCQRAAANGLIDLLWQLNRLQDALKVWCAAVALGLYVDAVPSYEPVKRFSRAGAASRARGGVQAKGPRTWLDLRGLSVGAAHVALFTALSSVSNPELMPYQIPETVLISVGRGFFGRDGSSSSSSTKESSGGGGDGGIKGGTVRECIMETIQRIGAPFRFSQKQPQCIEGRREDLLEFADTNWNHYFAPPVFGGGGGGGGTAVTHPATSISQDDRRVENVVDDHDEENVVESLTGAEEGEAQAPGEDLVLLDSRLSRSEGLRNDLSALDRTYWVMGEYIGWQSVSGWMRRCKCGEVLEPRKRKCTECGEVLPTRDSIKGAGFSTVVG